MVRPAALRPTARDHLPSQPSLGHALDLPGDPLDTMLRAERTRRSLRPADLAREVGVHPESILRWERRERLPGPHHLRALAAALDLDPAVVVGFFEAARPPAGPREGARGHGLRPLRQARGVSAATLAHHTGVGVATVYNWEAGRARIPAAALPRLGDLLGLDPDRLVALLRAAPSDPPAGAAGAARRSGPPGLAGSAGPVHPLRLLRHRSRLSQQQAATAAGVHRHTLGAWERGHARPSLAAARRLARTYGVPLATLAGAAGIAPPPLLDPRRWRPGDLAEVLRTLRAWTGGTQRRVAVLCGCSPTTVRAWEAGRTTPRADALRRLERAYRLPHRALDAAV